MPCPPRKSMSKENKQHNFLDQQNSPKMTKDKESHSLISGCDKDN
jgi:hypothetical protein